MLFCHPENVFIFTEILLENNLVTNRTRPTRLATDAYGGVAKDRDVYKDYRAGVSLIILWSSLSSDVTRSDIFRATSNSFCHHFLYKT